VIRGVCSDLASHKSRTIGRSFRIDEQWLTALSEEAERSGISSNAFMNKILQEYFEFQRFARRFGTITLSQKSFSSIIDACPTEALTEIGKKAGSVEALDIFRTVGLKQNHEDAIYYVTKILSEYANLFKFEHYIINNKEYFHLRHNLGEKWSICIAEVVSAVLEFCCNRKVKKELLEDAVTLELSLSPYLNGEKQKE
jgi:hypothetical protein